MKNSTPWHIITKFFQKTITQEELSKLNNWLKEDTENEVLLSEAYNIYSVTHYPPQPFSPDIEMAWKKIDKRLSPARTAKKNLFGKIKYAAAVAAVFAVALSYIWLNNESKKSQTAQLHTEIVTPMGQKTMVILPDSSIVWLNSGSSLKYNGDFNLKERKVVLKGEGYFEVKKNTSKRFRVKTGMLNVDVYGTAFNIKNHGDDNFQEITVAHGRVGISDINGEIKQLTRGDQALVNKDLNTITFRKSVPDVVSAWRNNELIFDNTPLEEVIKYMERWYGVNITIDVAMKGKHNYTFKIKTESLREMLEMMKVMTPLEYEINGQDVKIRYAN
jgi:ferric-dicitrate binding protein FerR (iron transport regulator)